MKKLNLYRLMLIALSLIDLGCVSVFSDMQGARLAGKGKFEATPGFSTVVFSEDLESLESIEYGYVDVGIQMAYGVGEKVDLRARFESIWLMGYPYGPISVQAGFGPKVSLVKDRIALYTPLGFSLDSENIWEFQPTLLFTIPIVRSKIDLNPSLKYMIPFAKGREDRVAVNVGFAISTDISKWAIRPEYGLLYHPDEGGYFGHFSVGLSVNFSNLKKN